MRHGNSFKKLNRTASHRRALLRNMATSFLQTGKIETTVPKAKALRPVVEKIITKGKQDSLVNRRYVISYLQSKEVASKVFSENIEVILLIDFIRVLLWSNIPVKSPVS